MQPLVWDELASISPPPHHSLLEPGLFNIHVVNDDQLHPGSKLLCIVRKKGKGAANGLLILSAEH